MRGSIRVTTSIDSIRVWFEGFSPVADLPVMAFIATGLTAKHPLIQLRVVAKRNVWVSPVLILIYGFGVMSAAFVLRDYPTRVQGSRDLEIGDAPNWITLVQFLFVLFAALLLRRIDARLLGARVCADRIGGLA